MDLAALDCLQVLNTPLLGGTRTREYCGFFVPKVFYTYGRVARSYTTPERGNLRADLVPC